ncbi:MAG: MATE family efflux transporter [Armatimonadetes bacterium]|nr:MATE family efflux transporter [Armatimonadota bacterium]
MLAGNVIQNAYNIINSMWVGKFLGARELAATTVSRPVIFMLIAAAGGLTMASGILVAQYSGARNWEHLRRVVQTSVTLVGAISLAIVPLGVWLAPLILSHLRVAPGAYALAVSYLRVFLMTIPPSFGVFLIMSMMRGMGDSKTPLYFQGSALALTAILTPILMFGWLGFPRLGLNGTAWASVVMQAANVAAMFVYLRRKDHILAMDWRHLGIHWPTAWLTIKIGLPSAIQHSLMSLGMLVVLRFVNAFGQNATAAIGAAMPIDQLAFMPSMTIGMAVSTLVGQNIGARKLERVRETFSWSALIAGGIGLLVSLVAMSAPGLLLRAFLNDAEAIRIGVGYLRIVSVSYVLLALVCVGNGVLNGAGHTFITTFITLISLWVVRVPLTAYLSGHMHRVEGIWWAMVLSTVLSAACSLGCYRAGIWKRPVVRHAPVKLEDAP